MPVIPMESCLKAIFQAKIFEIEVNKLFYSILPFFSSTLGGAFFVLAILITLKLVSEMITCLARPLFYLFLGITRTPFSPLKLLRNNEL
jgi:hypothetical protein